MSESKDVVILYHADCLDGFGSAFAAWKKFGERASYIPVKHHEPPPEGLDGKEVYIIDFSYPKSTLLNIEKNAKQLVVLDHHRGTREAVEAVKEHVFDNERSGTGIAWDYFHQDARPRLVSYVEDEDLWRFSLPQSKEICSFLSTVPFDFAYWDTLAKELDDDMLFAQYVKKGEAYREYIRHACDIMAQQAKEVEFEGYRVLAINAPRLFNSPLGNRLAEKHPPFGIVWYEYSGTWRFSMRGDGTVDLSELARRHGGNGHHNAAAFNIKLDDPFPWDRV